MTPIFCSNCGTPMVAGAQFCSSCGAPVAIPPSRPQTVPTATPSQGPGSIPLWSASAGSAPLPPPPPPAANLPPLSATLGLQAQKSFLVQHQMLSFGHSFRVMDAQKNHLFTVQGNVGQNLTGNMLGSLFGGSTQSGYFERMVARSVDMSYTLVNAQGTVHGMIRKQGGANSSVFTLLDLQGQPRVTVTLQRGLMGGITATAVDPSGRPIMQTQGNLLRHNFMIKDPAGKDLAKVHEAWVAIRDTYNLDILGNIDPLYPLVYAILIDFEKVK